MIRRGIYLHGLDTTVVGADLEVEYVYPGTIDVDVSDSVRVPHGRDAQVMTLGHCPAEPSLTAELALDASRWTWRPHTTPKAQIWVRHVFAADLARQNLWYEFEGQVVLVWHDLPTRESELALLAANFRPSLATWRAPATDDARALVRELVRAPVANGRPSAMGTMPAGQPATGDAQDRAQNAWMRWSALFGDRVDVGDRAYRLRGRPRLRGERLTIELLDRKSTLRVHFDVGLHPLVVRVHFDLDGRLLELGGLAWADFPHAIADLVAFRAEAHAQPQRAKAAASEPVSIDNAPTDKPGAHYAEAGAALRALGLPRSDYLRYKRQAEKAIEQGKSYLPAIRRARRKADKLRGSHARSTALTPRERPGALVRTWPELVVDAFNAEPGPRLAFARRHGPVSIFTVYPEDGDVGRPLASVDIQGFEVEDVRWLDDRVSASTQELIEDRLEHALEIARSEDDPDAKARPPLDGLIDLMRRRGHELGVDLEAAARPGRTDEYARIATLLNELSDRTGTTAQELAGWLISHGLHKAGDMVEEFVAGDEPIEPFIVTLWDELSDAIGIGEVIDAADGFRVPVTALFDHGQGHTAVILVREPVGRGAYLLRRISVVVRACEDDDDGEGTCGVEDPKERLQGGQTVWLRTTFEGSDFYRELHERVRDFEESVRRAPRTLQDVRVLLYWTTAMIESPRCQGDLKRAVLAALEEAKHYYDLAARRLGEGRDADAVTRMHEALRRISAAAAELAKSCGEGQEALVRPELPVSPDDAAIFDGPRLVTASARGIAASTQSRAGRDAAQHRLVSSAASWRRTAPVRAMASARPEGDVLGQTRRTSAGTPGIPAEVALARMDRLLRVYSGGRLAGRIVRSPDPCLVVHGVASDPEFPTLVLPDVESAAMRLAGRDIATIVPSPPCVHHPEGGTSVWLDHLLAHVQAWAMDSVLGQATPCIHHIRIGRGAWEGARMSPIANSRPCDACPFVLGTNLDCGTCRSWILARKRQGPRKRWSVEAIKSAIEPWCGIDAHPAATAAVHALGAVKDGVFLSRRFFQEFAAEFAIGLAGTAADSPEPRERCRLCVEALFVRPDFAIVETLDPGEYEAWIARFHEVLAERGIDGRRSRELSIRLAAETLRTWRQLAVDHDLSRRLVAGFAWLADEGLDPRAIEDTAREAADMTGGPAHEPDGHDTPSGPVDPGQAQASHRMAPANSPARREGRY